MRTPSAPTQTRITPYHVRTEKIRVPGEMNTGIMHMEATEKCDSDDELVCMDGL
jgi:hypothetical protein